MDKLRLIHLRILKSFLILLISILLFDCAFGSEIIAVKLSDGETVLGKLDLPETKDIPTLVIFIHGTGPNTYLNKRKISTSEFNYYDLFATEFNKRGIGFFTYNRRGVEIGDEPPYFDKINSEKYTKYLPLTEAQDVESIINTLKSDKRLKKTKIVLLGASEGTMVATIVADRKIVKIDALLLFGYANDNLYDIIKWQLSGKASMVNLRKYFDVNKDDVITETEYTSSDTGAVVGRRMLGNASLFAVDNTKDGVLDYRDFEIRLKPYFESIIEKVEKGDDEWIWINYFRVTTPWLKQHFSLEANKIRMMRLELPIFIFHGIDDGNTPVEGVYDIMSSFKEKGKTNLKCFVFEGHNHDLNFLDLVFENKVSEGLKSIFNTCEGISTK